MRSEEAYQGLWQPIGHIGVQAPLGRLGWNIGHCLDIAAVPYFGLLPGGCMYAPRNNCAYSIIFFWPSL